MTVLLYMIPCALVLGLVGVAGFAWALANGQFDDPAGAAARILQNQDRPL